MSRARRSNGKKITSQQLIGNQGVTMARERIGELGFLFYETGQVEAGIDGFIELRDQDGKVRAQFLAAQIKATDKGSYTAETDTSFEYLCKPEDFEYWSGANVPVILILARLEDKTVYWKEIDSTLVRGGVPSRRLVLSKQEDRLDQSSGPRIAQLAVDRSAPGTYLPAPRLAERLDLNLLRVEPPKTVYMAATEYIRRDQALDAMLERTEAPPLAWTLRNGRIASFSDLSVPPLSVVADPGTVEAFTLVEFDDDQSEEHKFLLELMYRTLESQLSDYFVYDRNEGIYYFPPGEAIEYEIEYFSVKKKTKCWAVRKYEGKEKLAGYVRHRAFTPKFLFAGGQWLLSIMPAWKFTKDGSRDDPFASSRIAWLKRQENNNSVRGQFFFVQHCLTTALESLIGPLSQQQLRFAKLAPFESDRSVPDRFWLSRDETPPPAGTSDPEEETDE